MEPIVEQRFADIKKRELIDIYFANDDDTEILRITLYKAVRRSEYFLIIHRYKNLLYIPDVYTDDFTQYSLFYSESIVGHTIGEAVQALKQALEKHVPDYMVIDSLWIMDKNLQKKAGITFEEKKLVERLEKILALSETSQQNPKPHRRAGFRR